MKKAFMLMLVFQTSLGGVWANSDTTVLKLMKKLNIPGLSYAIIKEGVVVQSAQLGKANVELDVPLQEENIFPIFSTTKAFTGVAVMKLVEEGKLKLGDQIGLYLDSLPSHWKEITIYQLMTLTSGLPDVVIEQAVDHTMDWVTDDEKLLVKKLAAMPMQFKPGESWQYNQANLSLMGMIIKKVTGMPYTDYVQKGIFEPLGMNTAKFGDVRKVVPCRVSSYAIQRNMQLRTWNTYLYPDYAMPNAGINLGLEDMVRFCRGITGNKLLKEENQRQLYTVAKLKGNKENMLDKGLGFGMGWMVMDVGGVKAYGMSGGAATGFLIFPAQKISVVLLTNASGINVEEAIMQIASPYLSGN